MARGRGLVAEGEGQAADVLVALHRPLGIGDQHRAIGRLAIHHADREGLDLRRARLGQHIGERAEIPDLDPPEAHRLDHRGIVGGDDDLDLLAEALGEVVAQRLRVLDQRGRVLVGQQRHAQQVRVGVLRGSRQGEAESGEPRNGEAAGHGHLITP